MAELKRRPLGKTGMDVSIIGLGTVKLGRATDVKYPTSFDLPSDREARALLDTAKALGINLLDTAPAYGTSEERLGALIGHERSSWLISTKVGETYDEQGSSYNFDEAHTIASINRSLARLNTDYLDIVLVHSDGRDLEILEQFGTLDVLKTQKRAGKVRAVGISVKSPEGVRAAVRHSADVVMASLNATYREEQPAIAEAGATGVGILVKKALASGHAGPDTLPEIAGQPGVSSIVIGTINPEHLAANCAAVSGEQT